MTTLEDSMNSLLKRPRARAALSGLARVDANPATRRAALLAVPAMLEQRFSPTAAQGLHTTYELRVLAPSTGDDARELEASFALAIADGELRVERRAAPAAAAWVGIGLGDMIRLVTGDTHLWALMADKRLDLGGEPFAALRFPALFQL